MAQRNCSGARAASLCYEQERLQVLQELEDTPTNVINVREELAADAAGDCVCTWQEELLLLLEDQNRLLYDILGAMTSLTAAQLALNQQSHT